MQDVDILGYCPYSQWENGFHRVFVTSSPAWGTIECGKPSELDPTAHLLSNFSQTVAPWPLNSCHYKLSSAFHAFSQGSPPGLHGSWLSSRAHLSCSLLSGGWPDLPHFPYFWDRKWGWGLLLLHGPPSPSNNAAFRYRSLPSIIYCPNMWLSYCSPRHYLPHNVIQKSILMASSMWPLFPGPPYCQQCLLPHDFSRPLPWSTQLW